MKHIGDLFDKYKDKIKAPQATVIKECVDSIELITGYKIDAEQVSYVVSTRTIKLQVPSILKTEIKFKQQAILDDLQAKLGADSAPKVIL